MEALNAERGIRDFVIVDDIFNVPPPRAKSILRKLIRRLPGIRLSFPDGLRADQVDGELLDLLQEAGTQQLALAVETASPRMQRVIGKNLHLDKARDAIEEASKRFIVTGFFMVGLPGETLDEAMMTVGFAEELIHLAVPTLSVVRVYPGTPLWSLLDPTLEQEAQLREQCSEGLLPRLMDDPAFYGDSFNRDQVPMTGSMVRRVRWEWARRVLYNPDRIRAANETLRRFIDGPELLLFYGQQFDRPDFSSQDLSRLLGGVRGGRRANRRPDGQAPVSA